MVKARVILLPGEQQELGQHPAVSILLLHSGKGCHFKEENYRQRKTELGGSATTYTQDKLHQYKQEERIKQKQKGDESEREKKRGGYQHLERMHQHLLSSVMGKDPLLSASSGGKDSLL